MTMALVILLGILVLTVSYFTLIDGTIMRKVVVYESYKIQTTQDSYRPGDLVMAHVKFCKKRPIVPEVQWALIDTYMNFYEKEFRGTPAVQCYDTDFTIEKIPLDRLPGTYRFSGQISYRANPFRTVTITLDTNHFQVTR